MEGTPPPSTPGTPKKPETPTRNNFTIQQKQELIKAYDNLRKQNKTMSKMAAARELCLKYTSLNTLLSQREKIMNCSITSNKKVRPSAHPEIERATVEWFNSRSAKDANLSRPILQKKALDFARKSGSDYNPSMSFIARILKKEEISTKHRCGEAGSADLRFHSRVVNKVGSAIK